MRNTEPAHVLIDSTGLKASRATGDRCAECHGGYHAQSARPAHSNDPGEGAEGLAKDSGLWKAVAGGNRYVPLQDPDQSHVARLETSGTEDRSPGRLLGSEPDGPTRHASLAASCLKGKHHS